MGAESFGQGVMKRLRSRGGTLEPHPLETQHRWGRPTGLCASSGARRRCTSTMCTKTGSSYPVTPQRLAPGGWEEWETRRVEFESKGRPGGCPREYRKPGVMLCDGNVCARRDGPWPARRFCVDGKKRDTEAALAGLPKTHWDRRSSWTMDFQRATTDPRLRSRGSPIHLPCPMWG